MRKALLCLALCAILLAGCASHRHAAYSSDPQPSFIETGTIFDGIESDTPVLDEPEVEPSFPGGLSALYKYLASNIHYPYNARENGTTGRVYVSFIVEKDGSISTIKMLHDIGGSCGAEVVRLVRSMPRWIPAQQDGQPVRALFNLPVSFDLR